MNGDLELLRRYAREGAEDAFAELTQAHLPLVYSAALRQTRSPQLAEEVAQSVFLDLARNATTLPDETLLSAWLYRVACRTAVDAVRRESRRQGRERLAQDFNHMNAEDSPWNQIEPLLDEAMTRLDEQDRAAVVLRYFEGKSFREVGEAIGASEDAAQKRVSRAVERLRDFFSGRGIAVGAVALAALISANSILACPTALSTTIAAAVANPAKATTTVLTTTKTIAMTTLQKTLVTAVIIATAAATIYETRQARALRGEVTRLQENQAPLQAQLDNLAQEHRDMSNRLASLREQNQLLQRERSDLARLRAEVSRLRQSTNELAQAAKNDDPDLAAATSWKDRLKRLRERLAQTPSARIPELQLITDDDWLNAAKGDLNSDEDYRRAFAALRFSAENKFIGLLSPALGKYIAANNQQFPTDLGQLQEYFSPPLDPAILDRYTIVPASSNPNVQIGSDQVVVEKTPADPDYDVNWVIGPNGFGNSGTYSAAADQSALAPAYKAYLADHQSEPNDPALLQPYLTTPAQQAALQRVLTRNAKN